LDEKLSCWRSRLPLFTFFWLGALFQMGVPVELLYISLFRQSSCVPKERRMKTWTMAMYLKFNGQNPNLVVCFLLTRPTRIYIFGNPLKVECWIDLYVVMSTADAFATFERQFFSCVMPTSKLRRLVVSTSAIPLRCSLSPVHNSIEHKVVPVNYPLVSMWLDESSSRKRKVYVPIALCIRVEMILSTFVEELDLLLL
jgi:hypothetical protein